MAIIEQLAGVFREEAAEHLALLETVLLELAQRPADPELVAQAFRSLHTIKGSGSMAGFDAIVGFVHEVESVFAQIRQGRLAVTPEIIALALETKDFLRLMLDPATPDCPPGSQRVREAFRAILVPSNELPTSGPACPTPTISGVSSTQTPTLSYRIQWLPHRDFFQEGTSLLGIAAELASMGVCRVTTDLSGLPGLEEMDPIACYLRLDLLLRTSKSEADIRDVFIFVDDRCDVRITLVPEDGKPGEATPLTATEVTARETPPNTSHHAPEGTSSVRVSAHKLDSLVDLVGELVIAQARLAQLASLCSNDQLLSVTEEIGRLASELRGNTLDIRMVPIGTTFTRFKRLVHDLGCELGKSIQLETEGAETELDKTMIERLSDPLVHIIRNSCDHGIESPEARRQAGKPATGTVRLSAYHSGQSVFIEIHDDGAGMDPAAIRRKAIAQGLLEEGAQLSPEELYRFIFLPGFSTAKTITNLSGRGVGMDVVKRSVESLRGQISVASERGRGSTIRLQLPLTLAIIEGLLVAVGDARFVLPMAVVEECIELTAKDVARAHGNHLANLRGDLVPTLRLRDWFATPGEPPAIEQIAITLVEGRRFGFVIDRVVGQHQTVIKSLGRMYQGVRGISGASILGDGTLALIIDIPALLQAFMQRAA